MPPVETPVDPRLAYTRLDGTVEYAKDFDDAAGVCPALGRMAIEQPEQFNLMRGLYSLGLASKPPAETAKPKPSVPEQPAAKPKPAARKTESALPEATPPRSLAHELPPKRWQPEPHMLPTTMRTPAEALIPAVPKKPIRKKPAAATPKTAIRTPAPKIEALPVAPIVKIEAAAVLPKTGRTEQQQAPSQPTATKEVVAAEATLPQPRVRKKPATAALKPPAPKIGTIANMQYSTTKPVANETVALPLPFNGEPLPSPLIDMLPLPVEDAPDYSPLETETDPPLIESTNGLPATEIIETPLGEEAHRIYNKLIRIITDTETAAPLAAVEENPAAPIRITSLIAERPAREKPLTLPAIQEHAAAQPLEQSLVDLAELFENDVHEPAHAEVIALLGDITEKMAATVPGQYEQAVPEITPQLIEKILTLMYKLGYERPGDVLVLAVKENGHEYLRTILELIYQLHALAESKEFLRQPIITAGDDTIDPRQRLGTFLLNLAHMAHSGSALPIATS